ncbi:hypothetical protein XH80_06690 [Bradyrhizobium sp. CCBAU 45384]|nr:hypothetical protein [Bradyrhizobium sp. CCBAU 45384]
MLTKHLRIINKTSALLIGGSGIVSVARGMSLTFLAVKLQEDFMLTPASVGAVLGIGPFVAAFATPFVGNLSDVLGRKRLLVTVLALITSSLATISVTQSVAIFVAAQAVGSVSSFVFEPLSRAALSDASSQEHRLQLFSWRYLAINVGWGIGPLVALLLGPATALLFIVSSIIYAVVTVAFTLIIPSDRFSDDERRSHTAPPMLIAFRNARRDARLLLYAMGGLLILAVHGQWTVTLSQYMNGSIKGGLEIFSFMVTTNAAVVLLANRPAKVAIQYLGEIRSLMIGVFFFALGTLGFALSDSALSFIVSMAIFSLGEVLVVPSEFVAVDRLCNIENRGTYFGVHSMSSMGNFVGPFAAGYLLGQAGGSFMFGFLALLVISGGLLYLIGSTPCTKLPYLWSRNEH